MQIIINSPIAEIPSPTGIAIHIKNIYQELINKGHVVHLIVNKFNEKKQNNLFVYGINLNLKEYNYILFTLKSKNIIKKITKQNKINAIHDRYYHFGGGGVLLKTKIPRVCHLIGNFLNNGVYISRYYNLIKPFDLFWTKKCLKLSNAILINSNSLKKELGNHNNIQFIPPGVNLPEIKNKNTNNIISFVGEIAPWHDVETLIKAAKILIKENKKLLFIIVGGNKYNKRLNYLKNLTKDFKSNFLFTGSITNENALLIMANSTLTVAPFIKTSRTLGFTPLKILESLSVGTPVLASNNDFNTEMLGKDFLYQSGNAQDLAEKIDIILKNDKLRNELSNKGKKLIQEKYNLNTYVNSLIKFYETLT